MMKKITLLMFVSLMFGMTFAQTDFIIDYDGYDETIGASQGYNYQRFIWPLNTTTAPIFGNMQWVSVDYNQLIVTQDGLTYTTLPASGSYNVTVDSVYVYYNYAPEKDTVNNVTFSIFDFDDLARDGFGIPQETADPVGTSTPLFTQSFSSSNLTISPQLEILAIYPNLALTPGQNFTIYMQNVSDTLDVFNLLAGYNENCGDAELALLSEAAFNSNSLMGYDPGAPLSPGLYNWGPATYTCRNFYTQNWVILPFVTITSDSLVVEAQSNQLTTETCPGSITTLSGNAFGGSGNYTFEWSPATGLSSTSGPNVIATVGDDTQEYVLTVTDVDSGDVLYDTVPVISFDVSVTASGPSDLTIACGTTTNINAVATTEGNGFTITSVTWTGNNTNPLQVSTSGQYIVTATNNVGCTATDTVNVSVDGENSVSFDLPSSICSGEVVVFDNTSQFTSGWGFNWYLLQAGDTLAAAGGEDFPRQFDDAGNYLLYCVGDSAGCEYSDFRAITVFDGTQPPCFVSISDLTFKAFAVYPNPAQGVLNVEFTLNSQVDVDIAVYGVDGKLIEARTFTKANEVNTTFNTSELNNGVYILKITTKEGTSTQKFVVSHN